MYNPSIHTATNKPIGLTNKPVDARTYFYSTVTFSYRPYANTAEVLSYLVGDNRVGQFSIIIGTDEYWFKEGVTDSDLVLKTKPVIPKIINIPLATPVPILIDFAAHTIKFGAAAAVDLGYSLDNYRGIPTILYKKTVTSNTTDPLYQMQAVTEEWTDSSQTILSKLYAYPQNDGSVTLEEINIIIKP